MTTPSNQQALDEFNRYFTSANGVDVGERVSVPRDEWRKLYDSLRSTSQPGGVPEGLTVEKDFQWNSIQQHHVPTLLIKFTPVPANSPCDAKGWRDRDHVAKLLTAALTPPAAPANGFQAALDIRTAQGWTLTGKAVPVLYTDTVNGRQVMRDDLWLATTNALKAEQPASAAAGPSTLHLQRLVEVVDIAYQVQVNNDQAIEFEPTTRSLLDAAKAELDALSAAPPAAGDEAKQDLIAQRAARWQWVAQFLSVDDVGDDKAVYSLVVDGDEMELAAYRAKAFDTLEICDEDTDTSIEAIVDAAIAAQSAEAGKVGG